MSEPHDNLISSVDITTTASALRLPFSHLNTCISLISWHDALHAVTTVSFFGIYAHIFYQNTYNMHSVEEILNLQ